MAKPLTGTSIPVQVEPTLSEPISWLQPGDKLYLLGSLTEGLGLKGECWTYQNGQPRRFEFELLEPLTLRLTPLESDLKVFGSNGENFENLKRTTHDRS